MRYHGAAVDPLVADATGNRLLVDGSLRRVGTRLRDRAIASVSEGVTRWPSSSMKTQPTYLD